MRLRYKVVLVYGITICLWAMLVFYYANRGMKTQLTVVLRDDALVQARLVGAMLLGSESFPARGQATGSASEKVPAFSTGPPARAVWVDLQDRTRAVAAQLGKRVTILAADGSILADSAQTDAQIPGLGSQPEVVQARSRGWGADLRQDTDGSETVFVALADRHRGTVIRLGVPFDRVHAVLSGLRSELFKAVVLASVWGLVVSIWLAHGITRSLGKVALVAQRIGEGDLTARADRTRGADEVASLGRTMNDMAESLQRAIGELAHTTAQLKAVLTHMADGLVAVDAQEQVILMNPVAGHLLRVDPQTARGRKLGDVCDCEDLLDPVRKTLQLGILNNREFSTSAGEERVLHVSAAPVRGPDKGRQGAVIVLRDMTESRRLERLQQDFVANASHELRSPVTAIRSLVEALELGALQDPEVGPRFLEEIVAKSRYLTRVVEDVMQLARLENVTQGLAVIKVRSVVEAVVRRLGSQAEAAGISLTVQCPKDACALGAAENLDTAVGNLIENALKYASGSGRVEVEVDERAGRLRIAVIDHGPGISGDARERVFERFYRVDKARAREMGGTGLGLSIVRQAVENMGGQVWLEDTPGGGATFVITLALPPDDGLSSES